MGERKGERARAEWSSSAHQLVYFLHFLQNRTNIAYVWGHMKGRKRALTRTKSASTLVFNLPASRTMRRKCLLRCL